mmetsp:Transcript_51265/g.111742  ORF Transcript_51265/g.111742 Transcript_51265/m.111742 type:complete len:459 (+) Transcript_51265:116-1492(+)
MTGESQMGAKLLGEFVGTFLLIFTVGCNVLAGNAVWAGVSIACVLMVSIYALGGISGANFNPAVSFCLAITNGMGGPGGMDMATAGKYAAAQITAGIGAGFLYTALYGESFALGPGKDFGWLNAGIAEFLYTFMLCFVVLNAAVARDTMYYGLAIGFVIVAGAYGAGAISGGCFNPAVAIAIDFAASGRDIGGCALYIFFELLGAAMAAVATKLVRPGLFGERAEPKIFEKCASEFLGTYFLVLTVGLNVLGSSPAGAFSIAAALMCMIYSLGDVSGAHFNPAVTIAIAATKRNAMPSGDILPYICSQVAGGVCAAFTYSMLYLGASFPLGPVGDTKWTQVAVAEIMFTFVLCYVVLSVAVSTKTNAPQFFGLAIGSCVTVGGFAIGGISGGSLNPAVSVGIATADTFNGGNIVNCLVYALFEVIGALMAAGVFEMTHAVDLDQSLPVSKKAAAEERF